MKNNSSKPTQHENFIDFEPEPIKLVTLEELAIARDYYYVLGFLLTPKTVKEIHEALKEKGYRVTRKTIYRHLEKLEEKNFVTIAGFRTKKGRGSPEKLYQRTAKLFYLAPTENYEGTEWEKSERIGAENLAILLRGLFQTENQSNSSLSESLWEFFQFHHQIIGEIVEKSATNEELAKTLYESDLVALIYLIDLATAITTLIREPKLLNQIKDLLNANSWRK